MIWRRFQLPQSRPRCTSICQSSAAAANVILPPGLSLRLVTYRSYATIATTNITTTSTVVLTTALPVLTTDCPAPPQTTHNPTNYKKHSVNIFNQTTPCDSECARDNTVTLFDQSFDSLYITYFYFDPT